VGKKWYYVNYETEMSSPVDLESFVQAAGDAIIAAKPDGTIIFGIPLPREFSALQRSKP